MAAMTCITSYRALGPAPRSRVVAIGNFDGVHRGHQHVLRIARDLADGGEVVVLTFSPHPAKVLAPAVAPPLICTPARKRELVAACGIDVLIEEPFDAAFAARSPESFVDDVLLTGLGATQVCVGHDFTFGSNRAGTAATLVELLGRRGRAATVVPAFCVAAPDDPSQSLVCSSTRVRQEVRAGRPERAALLLGRDPEVEGTVVRGAGRGRPLGVPTANLQPETELLPAPGVYAAWAELLGEERQVQARHPAAVSVGQNLTFATPGTTAPVTIEAHLLGPGGTTLELPSLYGRSLRLALRAYLRPEQCFPSPEALVEQIRTDIAAAARALQR